MTIEGLGKKFQEARLARGLTLDEAARMTKIRPSRLAEIEADDFSQFPSLAYAKGFLLIYGKFLEVDITQYLEAFETSSAGVTVDGYSYLQEDPVPAPTRTPVVRRRPARVSSAPSSSGERTSLMPLIIGVIVIVIGFFAMRLVLNLGRLAPRRAEPAPVAQTSPVAPPVAPTAAPSVQNKVVSPPPQQAVARPAASIAPTTAPIASIVPSVAPTTAPVVAAVSPPPIATSPKPVTAEPEVRRAEPVRPEDLKKAVATETQTQPQQEPTGPNRVAIKPLKKTYVKVTVDDDADRPAFERWISPGDAPIEFRGQKISVRVLDRDAVQIKKNGKAVASDDEDVTIE